MIYMYIVFCHICIEVVLECDKVYLTPVITEQ